jgi:hypothetical protein
LGLQQTREDADTSSGAVATMACAAGQLTATAAGEALLTPVMLNVMHAMQNLCPRLCDALKFL